MFELLVLGWSLLAVSGIAVALAIEVVGTSRAMRDEYNRSLHQRDERIAGAKRLEAGWAK